MDNGVHDPTCARAHSELVLRATARGVARKRSCGRAGCASPPARAGGRAHERSSAVAGVRERPRGPLLYL